MRADPAVEVTHGATLTGLCHTLLGTSKAMAHLEAELRRHMVALGYDKVVESIPGMGRMLGARILSEIGDDLDRFQDAAALKAYAGTSPVTVTSGKQWGTHVRHACNKRLQHATFLWAFMAITHSSGARAHYDRKRHEGKRDSEATRHLSNKLLGSLYHCLKTKQEWSELKVHGVDERVPWRGRAGNEAETTITVAAS